MTTATYLRRIGARLARAWAFGLLALAAALIQSSEARAQWATSGATTTTTNSVGVGTADPTQGGAVGSRFTVAAPDDTATAFATSNGSLPRFALNNHSDGSWTMHDYAGNIWNTGITQRGGSVGVGTRVPGFKFDVQGGAVNASGGLCIAGDCKTSWSQVGGVGQWTTSGSSLLYNTGSIGIATQAAGSAKLVIGGTPGAEGLDLATSDQYANLRVIRNSNSGFDKDLYLQYGAGAGSKIHFYNDNNESMTLVGGRLGLGTNTPAVKLDVNGDIRVSGNITAKYQDVAEWVPTKQRLAAATVVVLDTAELNHVRESGRAYDTGVAGVISAQPGISLGEAGEGKVLVATTGRVKVKVDASRGAIRVGDLLVTSDVAGVAMKSQPLDLGGVAIHRPGTIIGKALEPLAGGTGEILVLLSLQ
ncbi:MAG TPA: hypothetical protein VIP46_08205 [Pyrinomonadaceae bacterium]